MKNKKITIEATVKESKTGTITGIANSFKETLNGHTYLPVAFEASLGKTVPLLVSHEWGSLPVGTATFGEITEEGVTYSGTIFDNLDNRELLLEQLASGTVGVSIGGMPTDFNKEGAVSGLNLLELSLTAIPADQNATAVLESLKFTEDTEDQTGQPTPPANDDEGDDEGDITLDDINDAIKAVSDKLDKVLDTLEADKPKDDDADETAEALAEAVALIDRSKLRSMEQLKTYKRLKGML